VNLKRWLAFQRAQVAVPRQTVNVLFYVNYYWNFVHPTCSQFCANVLFWNRCRKSVSLTVKYPRITWKLAVEMDMVLLKLCNFKCFGRKCLRCSL